MRAALCSLIFCILHFLPIFYNFHKINWCSYLLGYIWPINDSFNIALRVPLKAARLISIQNSAQILTLNICRLAVYDDYGKEYGKRNHITSQFPYFENIFNNSFGNRFHIHSKQTVTWIWLVFVQYLHIHS